jgi:hypothetical protein
MLQYSTRSLTVVQLRSWTGPASSPEHAICEAVDQMWATEPDATNYHDWFWTEPPKVQLHDGNSG